MPATMIDDLLPVLVKLEKSHGPNRELGDEILLATGWTQTSVGYFHGPIWCWRDPKGRNYIGDAQLGYEDRPDPTESFNAAMALVPVNELGEPMCVNLEIYSDGSANCHIIPFWLKTRGEEIWSRKQATPVIAICVAALRAQMLMIGRQRQDKEQ